MTSFKNWTVTLKTVNRPESKQVFKRVSTGMFPTSQNGYRWCNSPVSPWVTVFWSHWVDELPNIKMIQTDQCFPFLSVLLCFNLKTDEQKPQFLRVFFVFNLVLKQENQRANDVLNSYLSWSSGEVSLSDLQPEGHQLSSVWSCAEVSYWKDTEPASPKPLVTSQYSVLTAQINGEVVSGRAFKVKTIWGAQWSTVVTPRKSWMKLLWGGRFVSPLVQVSTLCVHQKRYFVWLVS